MSEQEILLYKIEVMEKEIAKLKDSVRGLWIENANVDVKIALLQDIAKRTDDSVNFVKKLVISAVVIGILNLIIAT